MGIYFYTYSRQKRLTVKVDGEKRIIWTFPFDHKMSWDAKGEAFTQRQIDNAYNRFNTHPPQYVIFEREYTEGCTVYTNVTSGYWVDSDKMPCEPCGVLHHVHGRTWELKPLKEEVLA